MLPLAHIYYCCFACSERDLSAGDRGLGAGERSSGRRECVLTGETVAAQEGGLLKLGLDPHSEW